jgi:hypothetical protein
MRIYEYPPHTFNLCTKCKSVVSFTLRLLYCWDYKAQKIIGYDAEWAPAEYSLAESRIFVV